MNWRNYAYLQSGTRRQRQAHATLSSLRLFETLGAFDPALVSTVCLNLDVAGSDLDVICERKRPTAFEATVRKAYGARRGFHLRTRPDDTQVARFETDAFPVEVFASSQSVEEQYAWRHLDVMKRLLDLAPALRPRVRAMKREGHATEEAFAELLGLQGDPFEALLTLEDSTPDQLASVIATCEAR